MQIIKANLLDVEHGIITHQVNCKGVMGAGLAKSLRNQYPVIYPRYHEFCKLGHFRPGMIQLVKADDGLFICNLAGQDGYGRDKQYTDYEALAIALPKLSAISTKLGLMVYIPHLMGCKLGGGDWEVVSALIDQHIPDAIICQP